MASFKNDFGLSGKLGDVIIYRMGNKSYARRTFRANNPKTIKQQEVRARFLVAIRFYQKLKETSLRRILKVSAQGNSFNGYTFYLEKNMKVFCADVAKSMEKKCSLWPMMLLLWVDPWVKQAEIK